MMLRSNSNVGSATRNRYRIAWGGRAVALDMPAASCRLTDQAGCFRDRPVGIGAKCALPYRDDLPAPSNQARDGNRIATTVVRELGRPKFAPRVRHLEEVAARMGVPEATIHENNGAPLRKDKIRTSGKARSMQAISESHGPEATTYQHFRLRVHAPDARHHPRAHRWCDDVDHYIK